MAIRGDETKSRTSDSDLARGDEGSLMIHAIPALSVEESQAASDLHVIDLLSSYSRGKMRVLTAVPVVDVPIVDCAWSHSRAAPKHFVARSAGCVVLSSKISLLRAVQSIQQTHGSTGCFKPEGGRQITSRNKNTALLKSESTGTEMGFLKGICLQTS